MTNPKIRDAQAAVRLLSKRLESSTNGVEHVVVGQALAAISAGLEAVAEEASKVVAVATSSEPPRASRELENNVVRTALEYRRARNRLRGFNASLGTLARELMPPLSAFEAAVEELALARDGNVALHNLEVSNG